MPPNAIEPTDLVTRRTKLFTEFRALTIKAQKTLEMDDAIAAGNAWRAYIDTFITPNQSATILKIKYPNRRAQT